jgi:hypothetical protein
MQLGKLKQAIRDMEGPPKVMINFDGLHITIHAQKTPLIAELDAKFTDGKSQETGLHFNQEGYLTREH